MKKCLLLCLTAIVCLTVNAQTPQSGKWELVKTTNKIAGRSECGLAAAGGKLYLIGGDGPVMPVEVFDPATYAWTKKASAPIVMHHFEAVGLDDDIYVLDAFYQGGFPTQDPAPNAYCYHTKTDTWQKLAGLPADRMRAGAGAAAWGGKLYLIAGIQHGHTSGTTNMFDVYDPKTDTWAALSDAPHIRDHSQAVVVKNKLYSIGGRNTSYHEPNNFMAFFSKTVQAVDCYNFTTGLWSTLPARLPMGTGGGTAVSLDGKIYYIGGERATDSLPNRAQKDVYFVDPATSDAWQKAPDLHIARNGVGGAVLDHKIYIAGGAGGPGGPPPLNGRPPGAPAQNGAASPPPPGTRPPGRDRGIGLEVFMPEN